jgi:hypothetical protein
MVFSIPVEADELATELSRPWELGADVSCTLAGLRSYDLNDGSERQYMPFAIGNAPDYIPEKFTRAMASLASSPVHSPQQQHLQLCRALSKQGAQFPPVREDDLNSAAVTGGQYLVSDG